jgi:hypothetical protein
MIRGRATLGKKNLSRFSSSPTARALPGDPGIAGSEHGEEAARRNRALGTREKILCEGAWRPPLGPAPQSSPSPPRPQGPYSKGGPPQPTHQGPPISAAGAGPGGAEGEEVG